MPNDFATTSTGRSWRARSRAASAHLRTRDASRCVKPSASQATPSTDQPFSVSSVAGQCSSGVAKPPMRPGSTIAVPRTLSGCANQGSTVTRPPNHSRPAGALSGRLVPSCRKSFGLRDTRLGEWPRRSDAAVRDALHVPADHFTEADVARIETCEGLRVARAKGRLRDEQPSLTPRRHEAHLGSLSRAGEHAIGVRTNALSVTHRSSP